MTTESFFASWNIDSSRQRSFFSLSLADARLRYLAGAIGGALIRFGGTGNDYLHYAVNGESCTTIPYQYECLNATWFEDLYGFSAAAASPLIFGLNITQQPWDAANAVSLLRFAQARNQSFWGLELGNEQNSKGMSAQAQAASLRVLASALDEVYGNGPDRPLLVGPDPSGFHVAPKADPSGRAAKIVDFLASFAQAALPLLHAVTHHEYIEIDEVQCTNSTFLDSSREIAKAVVAAVRAVEPSGRLGVWAGEIGPHNGGGGGGRVPNCENNRVCGRFGSTLWYLDSMASKAREGYSAYFRQDFIGADYGLVNYTSFLPTPDFWGLLVWRKTVGVRVLNATRQPASAHSLRVYAFCAPQKGYFTLVAINLGATEECLDPPQLAGAAPRVQWTLTPSDGTVTSPAVDLNGQALELDAQGHVPSVAGRILPAAESVALPPLSITFALYASSADACL
jgi:heparanase 1